jgi:clan AA aspartic protease
MGTFTVSVTLIHPDHRDRSVTVDPMVDTGATYTVLPADLVAQLGLSTPEERPGELASGERVVYRIGEVRVRLGEREHTNVFVEGPPGCPVLLGAFTLEAFGFAADPIHQRLIPVVARL